MELSQAITNVLMELRTASLSIQQGDTEKVWREVMKRYDMRFMGQNFNEIYSDELVLTLSSKFGIAIELDSLNSMLPNLCGSLGMKTSPLIAREDIDSTIRPIHSLVIYLH